MKQRLIKKLSRKLYSTNHPLFKGAFKEEGIYCISDADSLDGYETYYLIVYARMMYHEHESFPEGVRPTSRNLLKLFRREVRR